MVPAYQNSPFPGRDPNFVGDCDFLANLGCSTCRVGCDDGRARHFAGQ